MTTYYVGSGGNDANNGLTWATRKLTLNGAEDVPVVAGDIVYVAPGAYREQLTVDVSGAAGTPIVYIGDVTGEHTDGIGGPVRITGSDNDQSAARNYCINAATKNYRTFRGMQLDTCLAQLILCTGTCTNWILEDSFFYGGSTNTPVDLSCAPQNTTVQRCIFYGGKIGNYALYFSSGATVDNSGVLVQNCLFILSGHYGIGITRIGGVTIKNSTFIGGGRQIEIVVSPAAGQTITVNNCIFEMGNVALLAAAAGFLTEDYNTFWSNITNRTNVAVGANSLAYPALFATALLEDGFRFPWFFGELSKWTQVARITGTGEATDELFGLTRPVTASKNSWGAIQYVGATRETTTVDAGTASVKLPDAGEQFLMRCCVTAVPTTFTIKVYREANYAGTNPQMIIRQAGQADNTTTDAGAAASWNLLSATLTPAADPEWVDIFIRSSNTAGAGNYDVFFDTVTVS